MSDTEKVLRAAFYALDEITNKVDGTGFAESREFDSCLEVMAMLSAQLAASQPAQAEPPCDCYVCAPAQEPPQTPEQLAYMVATAPAMLTAEQPAQGELRRAVRDMVTMLNDREWGEHVSRDPDASDLESAITTLIGEVSEKQGRIDELERALTTNSVDGHKSGNVDDKPSEPKPYWIPCHVCGQAFNQSAGQVHCSESALGERKPEATIAQAKVLLLKWVAGDLGDAGYMTAMRRLLDE
jgi:hypothetical protein